MDPKKVLSIDIGIINLGYVFVELSETVNVLECNRINITHMKHNKVNRCDCKLHHDFCIPDYIDHFVQEYFHLFNEADVILIERQPPMGLQSLQELLFIKFREKVKLVNPCSIHKFFKMTKCDYDLRKIESETIAKEYLNTFISFNGNERKHDISDAMLMVLHYFKTTKVIPLVPLIQKRIEPRLDNFMDFEKFRFVKV